MIHYEVMIHMGRKTGGKVSILSKILELDKEINNILWQVILVTVLFQTTPVLLLSMERAIEILMELFQEIF